MQASDFFALPASLTRFAPFFPAGVAPWEWIKAIGAALAVQPFDQALPALPRGVHVEGLVYLHPTVKLPPSGRSSHRRQKASVPNVLSMCVSSCFARSRRSGARAASNTRM